MEYQQQQRILEPVVAMGISFRKILDSLFGTREMRVRGHDRSIE